MFARVRGAVPGTRKSTLNIIYMNHLETYQYEIKVPTGEREWLNWAARVESILGHSLDGDLTVNGYSLDRAHSTFMLGVSDREYVKTVKSMPQYNPSHA